MGDKNRALVVLCFLFLIPACTARQIVEPYKGATTHRLLSKSVDRMMERVPENDLGFMQGKKVFLEVNFLKEMLPQEYASARLAVHLERRGIKLVGKKEDADLTLVVFFTSLGSDRSDLNIGTPEFPIPSPLGGGPIVTIPKLSLFGADVYKGITEMYYYILDNQTEEVVRRQDCLKGQAYSNKYVFLFVLTWTIDDLDDRPERPGEED